MTVTCEEHYQDVIEASMPPSWDPDRTWPFLADLAMAESNPHTSHGTPCVEVRYGNQTIGYMTPKMTDRYADAVTGGAHDGVRVTANAGSVRGTKGGVIVWRVKLYILK